MLRGEAPAFNGGYVHHGTAASYSMDGLPLGWDEGADTEGYFAEMFALARRVYHGTACDLPGVSIKYESFISTMWAAVRSGHVAAWAAEFVGQGLRWGFEAGLSPSSVPRGVRLFRNYESSTGDFRGRVTKATLSRVKEGRTLDLGEWQPTYRALLQCAFGDYCIFPLGARAKPLEPDEARPTDDHTRTGTNAATDMSYLTHSLDAYAQIARHLMPGFAMHVSDVEAAFPMLPWAPWVWPRFFHRFYPGPDQPLHLYCHINGDFGTRGLPGVFKIFFVDVLVNMARAAEVVRLPLVVYVDDLAYIGSRSSVVRRGMMMFQDWATSVCGVNFKRIKDRHASPVQLMLGFWWDSFERTRTLEERKLREYMNMLLEFSTRKSLTLNERQRVAGRLQRAVLTMPPGASCLLANMFLLMAGLTLAWHKRRTTRAEREDYRFFYEILARFSGRGFFAFDHFTRGPCVYSDASKSRQYTGGGWVTSSGRADYFRYGTAAARRPIDFLEGDTVVDCVSRCAWDWRRMWIPFGVDNQSFQKSAVKGWSRALRLTLLLKRLFILQIQHECLLRFFWVSTHENVLADHLSRGRIQAFFDALAAFVLFVPALTVADIVWESDAGRVRTLDMSAPFNAQDMAALELLACQPFRDMYAYSSQVRAVVVIQAASRGLLARVLRRDLRWAADVIQFAVFSWFARRAARRHAGARAAADAARMVARGAVSGPLHAQSLRLRGSGVDVVSFMSGDQRPRSVINTRGVRARYELGQPGEYMLSESLQAVGILVFRFGLSKAFVWQLLTARPSLDVTLAIDDVARTVVGVALGFRHHEFYLTYLTAVRERYQGQGVGFALRSAQVAALEPWSAIMQVISLSSLRIDARSGRSAVHAQKVMLAPCGLEFDEEGSSSTCRLDSHERSSVVESRVNDTLKGGVSCLHARTCSATCQCP